MSPSITRTNTIAITTRASKLPTGIYSNEDHKNIIQKLKNIYPSIVYCGDILSGALESSNTNILNELVNMLQTQQAFNGNARILQSNVDVTRRLMDG